MNVVALTKKYSLWQGNCIDCLRFFQDNSVDLIFADPPYFLSNNGMSVHSGKRVKVNKGDWDKLEGERTAFDFHGAWIKECKRVLKKDTGSIWISGTYHSIYDCAYALNLQEWKILNDIIWYKPNATPNLSCRMFTASHETLIWARPCLKGKHIFNYEEMKNGEFKNDFLKKPGKQMRDVWAISPPSKKEKMFGKHPTQKPEKLLDRIILSSTKPGDLVVDPFCGSATTGVSCVRNGRRFIGIDQSENFLYEQALPRMIYASHRS